MATQLLVLWDIDQTLIEVGGSTRQAYAAAFRRATGGPLQAPWQFDGRTELAAATHVLRAHGIEPSPTQVDTFVALVVEELQVRAEQMRGDGRVLPGAEAALRAGHGLPGARQSTLTGNVYSLAELKLATFGLDRYLDLRLGAFGGDAHDRVDLPAHAWRRAEQELGHRFSGADTVIVGDTLLDVATARAAGARAIAVATGSASPAELAAAGADVVLPDLTDTAAVMRAIVSE